MLWLCNSHIDIADIIYLLLRSGEVASRRSHKPEIPGAIPGSATKSSLVVYW